METTRLKVPSAMALMGLLALSALTVHVAAHEIGLGGNAIENDGGPSPVGMGANLYPRVASDDPVMTTIASAVMNNSATKDWVHDDDANNDTVSLTNSVATGINLNPAVGLQTGAAKKGHWFGKRIVDGISGGDQDIFLTGGKENDTSTWNVGPGSVGSSKYDLSQAYLAIQSTGPSQGSLYFGMERSGNNGTTAFDFEFNAKPPVSGNLIPNRSVGDVLFTFEMQGSGGSGSAEPHVFTWNGTQYVENSPLPAGILTSINNASTPSAPWGRVNSKGVWDLSDHERFMFAEATAPFGAGGVTLPGFTGCAGTAFVQVRTRASSTPNSDLKDTSKIFQIGSKPTALLTLGTNCDQQFTYSGVGSTDTNGGSALSYHWDITVDPTKVLSLSQSGAGAAGFSGNIATGVYASDQATPGPFTVDVTLANGVPSAVISVNLSVTEGGAIDCSSSTGVQTLTVFRRLAVTAQLVGDCSNLLTFSSTVTGGKPPYSYAWSIQKLNADGMSWTEVATSTNSGGMHAAAADGTYRAVVLVTDTADSGGKPQCTAQDDSPSQEARLALNPTLAKGAPNGVGTAVTLNATAHAADSVEWQVRDASVGGAYTSIKTDPGAANDLYSLLYGAFKTDDATPSAVSFKLDNVQYDGLKYEVEIKIIAKRTLNGQTCEATAGPLKISYLEAVDPSKTKKVKQIR